MNYLPSSRSTATSPFFAPTLEYFGQAAQTFNTFDDVAHPALCAPLEQKYRRAQKLLIALIDAHCADQVACAVAAAPQAPAPPVAADAVDTLIELSEDDQI